MRSRFSCVLATVSVPGTESVSAEPSGQVTPLPANHSLSLAASAAVERPAAALARQGETGEHGKRGEGFSWRGWGLEVGGWSTWCNKRESYHAGGEKRLENN